MSFLARSRMIDLPPFRPPPFNEHFEGAYSDAALNWRRLCAVDKADNIVSLLGARLDEVQTILEVGCGTGAVVGELARRLPGRECTGVDVIDTSISSDPLIAETGVKLHQSDGAALPWEDNSFDLVFASHVLEHVENERDFLLEIGRVARKYVYVEVPCELTLQTNASRIQSTLTQLGHINSFTPLSFSLRLATSGLQVIEVQAFDHSEAVHAFHSSKIRAKVKGAIRSGLLQISPSFASKIFCYHVGALCNVRS